MSVSDERLAEITYGTEHPHEPEIPPALDAEGRCLVCGLLVRLEDAEAALRAEREKVASDDCHLMLEDLADEMDAASPEAHAWATILRSRYAALSFARLSDRPEEKR